MKEKEVDEKVFSIDLDNLNPGTWFDFDDGGRVCLRVCDTDTFRSIRKKITKKKVEYKQGQRHVFDDTDEDLQTELMWEYCIVDWANFKDKNGIDIPCNSDMKKLLMGKSIKFSRFVLDKFLELSEIEKERLEKEEKN
jgi:hypothetical protein